MKDSYDERMAGIDATVGQLQKKFGKGALTTMSEHRLEMQRISTGVLELDLALGGGVPRGRITEFFGPEESGKTTRMAATIANAQRCCVTCGMRAAFEVRGKIRVELPFGEVREVDKHVIKSCPCGKPRQCFGMLSDLEGTFDPDWFIKQGVWLEACYLSRPVTLEECIDVVQGALESGQFDVVAVDSVAMGTSAKEATKSASDDTVGLNARKWGEAMRKWQLMLQQNYRKAFDAGDVSAMSKIPTIILINQVRMKIGVMFGNPETTPAGKAIPFAASCRVRFSGSEIKEDKEAEERGVLSEHLMKFKVRKSKVSPSGYGGEYKLMQSDTKFFKTGQIDQTADLVKYGIKSEVIGGHQGAYTLLGYKDSRGKPLTFRGKSAIEELFAQDHELAMKMYDQIIGRMTGTMYSPLITDNED